MNFNIKVDTSALSKVLNDIAAGLSDCTSGPMADAMDESGLVYLEAMQDRFPAEGDPPDGWASLALETIEEREREGYPGPHMILTRSGVLSTALSKGAPGNLMRPSTDGIEVGIGGSDLHPGYKGKPGGVPISTIAAAHQEGTERLPARPILVDPDSKTLNAMTEPVAAGVQKLCEGNQ